MERMTTEEYKREINRVCRRGPTSSIRKNDPKTKVHRQAISAVPGIRGTGPMGLHDGSFAMEITIIGETNADIDNIAKGILDALNGTAYVDDRQCVELIVRREGENNFQGDRK